MRRAGRTPGILFSLPGDASILVSMETKHVQTLVRQSCCSCHAYTQGDHLVLDPAILPEMQPEVCVRVTETRILWLAWCSYERMERAASSVKSLRCI